jgi:hypothetical protein
VILYEYLSPARGSTCCMERLRFDSEHPRRVDHEPSTQPDHALLVIVHYRGERIEPEELR